jgi:hypothetical protein
MGLREELTEWVDAIGNNTATPIIPVVDDNYSAFKSTVKGVLGLVEDDVNNTMSVDEVVLTDRIILEITKTEEW